MSTLARSPVADDSKQQDTYSGKDDQKQQSALQKRETKNAPVADSSMIGGTIAALQSAVDSGINMLPTSLQDRAHSLEEQAKLALGKATEIAAPVVDAYQHDGILAAAKTAGGLGTQAASTAASSLKTSAAASNINTEKLQKSAVKAATDLKASAINLKEQATGAAINLKEQATGVAINLKEKIAPSGAAAAPKKHGRRRRGGRGHGNRKMKTRVLPEQHVETIVDTLGEKAKELKEVVIEDTPSSATVVSNVRNRVSSAASSVTSAASSVTSTASGLVGSASGLVSGAQERISQLAGAAKSTIGIGGKLERKPSLQRETALPALGTPMTPDSDTVTHTADGKLAAKPADQSSLLDKAKFAVGGVVEATRDFVADKIDNLSMNADDDTPMEGKSSAASNRSALKQAGKQLDKMKQSVQK